MTNNKPIRIRFAPSPTGFVHIGNLRTILYDYLIAKNLGGKFILRIEDTDQKRLVPGAVEKVLECLDWVGLKIDEGVVLGEDGKVTQKGKCGPYVQSERLEIYQKYAKELVEKDAAYPCFCSAEKLDEVRQTQQKNGQAPMYDRKCRELDPVEVKKRIESGEKHVIRLKVPEGQTVEFKDAVFGKISVGSHNIDDQVLMKADGFPTYHMAVVVDDHLMEISHITRADEWLPSTPKHILLYQAFGWEAPEFIHFPNVLSGKTRKKLSKRHDSVSVEDFRKKGYLPEALVNFLVLLGWNPKSEQEFFTLKELEEKFDVKGLHKAGAVFDYKKLDWMNSHYIKQKSDEELFELCQPYFSEVETCCSASEDILRKIIKIEKTRIKKLSEITENIDFYFAQPHYDKELLRWKKNSDQETKEALEKAKEVIEKVEDFALESLEKDLMKAAGDKRGDLLWPLRVALSGAKNSPSPFEIAWVLNKEEALNRVDYAINLI